jgi:hypothetical protein
VECGSTKDDVHDFLTHAHVVQEYSHVTVRDTVVFRSQTHSPSSLATWNCGIMMPYIVTGHDGNPKQKVAFGVIQRMFKHCITEGAASRILLEVDWFDTGGNEFDGEMPLVKPNPRSQWNKHNRYAFLSHAYAQNVVFWPRDLKYPNSPLKCAIWPRNGHRPLDV